MTVSDDAIFEEWPIGPPRCRSCGSMLRDLRRHGEDCTYRQAMQRRCEEAVEEWDRPQLQPPELRPMMFSDFRRDYLIPEPRLRMEVGIPLENGEGYLAYAPFETRHQPARTRVADLTVRITLPGPLPGPCEHCGASPYTADRFHAALCPVYLAWDSERREEQRRRYRFHRRMARQERRLRAKRALRTMLTRREWRLLAYPTTLMLILVLIVLGVVPTLAWLAAWWLIVYAIMLHTFLGMLFWWAYRQQGRN